MSGHAQRVFLDANILFSACRSDGAVRALLRMLHTAGCTLVVDEYVCAEARRNLELKAARDACVVLDALISRCEVAAMNIAMDSLKVPADAVDWLPEKDRPVMASAIGRGCHVLVTGDRRHFGAAYQRMIHGVLVLSPAQAYERLHANQHTTGRLS